MYRIETRGYGPVRRKCLCVCLSGRLVGLEWPRAFPVRGMPNPEQETLKTVYELLEKLEKTR